jgi:hypothetical protein
LRLGGVCHLPFSDFRFAHNSFLSSRLGRGRFVLEPCGYITLTFQSWKQKMEGKAKSGKAESSGERRYANYTNFLTADKHGWTQIWALDCMTAGQPSTGGQRN